MKKSSPLMLALAASLALVTLSGCERMEQAANEVIEQATQSAVQAIDEATGAATIDEARQSAEHMLNDARNTAAGLLGEASEYLAPGAPMDEELPAAEVPTTEL